MANNLCTCFLQYYHNYILTRYFGQNKTLELICHEYTWPSVCTDIKSFCNSYITCIRSKLQHYKPYRLLKQLPIPKQSWNLIFMDFIKKLSFSSKYNTILDIINQLSKHTIFILIADTIISYKLAKLFVIYIFFKHSVLSYVTSDYISEFVLNFFQSLDTTLDMQLYFTSRYHSERDGKIENTN